MIKSMTGFSSVTRESDHATITVTIRGVNHRYLDMQARLPQSFADLEARLRASVQRRIARGRIEVAVAVQFRQAAIVDVEFNEPLALALTAALDEARARGLVQGPLTPGDLLRLPQALAVRERPAERDPALLLAAGELIGEALEEALTQLDAMRATEGQHLAGDLDGRRAALAGLVTGIADGAEEGRLDVQARLAARVREMAADLQADETAIAQEIVRVAARSDISEEVVRFRGHLAHWEALSAAPEPCGRKLDFLLQEMNREINTMGSKADGLRVSELVIAAKAELEKMREQVQNVE